MNPFALIGILISLGLIIIAVKGTQDNVIAALKGKQYGNSVIK
jgi:hypothetical protein